MAAVIRRVHSQAQVWDRHHSRHLFTPGLLPGLVEPRYYTQGMSTELIYRTTSTGSDDTRKAGELLASNFAGGEVLELTSDLGGGKTTFTQGLAKGLGSKDTVASPTFTLSKIYKGRRGLEIHHYDFYRLADPGILKSQLSESLNDKNVITVVEWSDIVKDVLPAKRMTIKFRPTASDPDERQISISYPESYAGLVRHLESKRGGKD